MLHVYLSIVAEASAPFYVQRPAVRTKQQQQQQKLTTSTTTAAMSGPTAITLTSFRPVEVRGQITLATTTQLLSIPQAVIFLPIQLITGHSPSPPLRSSPGGSLRSWVVGVWLNGPVGACVIERVCAGVGGWVRARLFSQAAATAASPPKKAASNLKVNLIDTFFSLLLPSPPQNCRTFRLARDLSMSRMPKTAVSLSKKIAA